MLNHAKALIAKSWKNENAELSVGKHEVNETLIVRVRGQVEKHDDQMIASTISIHSSRCWHSFGRKSDWNGTPP